MLVRPTPKLPIIQPLTGVLGTGLPWESGGSGAVLYAPGAPTISGTPTVGGTLTITPNASPGSPAGTYLLYRDAVLVGAVVSGYTYVAADIGPSITVKATNVVGTSAASNALVWAGIEATLSGEVVVNTPGTIAGNPGDPVSSWANDKGTGTFNNWSMSSTARPLKGSIGTSNALDFDGTNDVGAPASTPNTLAGFLGTGSYHLFTVIQPQAIAGTNADVRLNECLLTDQGTIWSLGFKSAAGPVYSIACAQVGAVSGLQQTPLATIAALDVPRLVEVKYDGTTLSLKLDGGSFQTVAVGAFTATVGVMTLGRNFSTAFYNGLVGTIITCPSVQSAGAVADVRAYLAYTFGVTS